MPSRLRNTSRRPNIIIPACRLLSTTSPILPGISITLCCCIGILRFQKLSLLQTDDCLCRFHDNAQIWLCNPISWVPMEPCDAPSLDFPIFDPGADFHAVIGLTDVSPPLTFQVGNKLCLDELDVSGNCSRTTRMTQYDQLTRWKSSTAPGLSGTHSGRLGFVRFVG